MQNVTTLSDRLLRWVEFFSLFDFAQEYVPGTNNVLPDYLSRPSTEVFLILEDGSKRSFDLLSLALFLDAASDITPVMPVLLPSSSAYPFDYHHLC